MIDLATAPAYGQHPQNFDERSAAGPATLTLVTASPDDETSDGEWSPLDAADVFRRELARIDPEFVALAAAASDVIALGEQAATTTQPDDDCQAAFGRAMNLLLNDWIELLALTTGGQGRGAVRSARSIFEISLYMFDLLDSPDLARRYLDHAVVVAFETSEHAIEERLLKGKALKAARYAREKTRRRLRPVAEHLLKKHGSSFRRSWTVVNVADRAAQAGRSDEYSGYRLASAVAHGSSTGSLGSLLLCPTDGDEPHPVMRLGANPLLAATGLTLGLIAMRFMVSEASQRGFSAANHVSANLDELVESIPRVQELMEQIHVDVSPLRPPLPLQPFMRLEPNGLHTVWLHDTERDLVIAALPNNPAQAVDAAKTIRTGTDVVEPVNVTVWFSAVPKPGATWQPADDARLEPKFLYPPAPGTRVLTPDGAFVVDQHGLPNRD